MSRTLHRRRFLQAGLASGMILAGLPASDGLRAQERSPNEKLNLAFVGVNNKGLDNVQQLAKENVAVLCDVDRNFLDKVGASYKNAVKYIDYRAMLEKERNIDAVVVSTADHSHAIPTSIAITLGKAVYCEKPLTHPVAEARHIAALTARHKVVTQMGTQIHAGNNYRRVVELIQAGAIGPVREAHVWVGRAWGRQSDEAARRNRDIVSVQERPSDAMPVPSGLDWDLWIGPAPERPFHEVYFPGPKWYRWWDFGNGTMSDLGSHWIDLPFWALKLRAPLAIEASGPPPHPEIAPASMRVDYEYGPRDDQPAVRLTWYQGEEKPEPWRSGAIPKWDSGVLFVGGRGMLLADYGKHRLLPESDFRDFQRPSPTIPASIGHHAEWIRACKTGEPTTCNFDYAGWLTEANHLGNVAYRAAKRLEWDPVGLRASNAPEAGPFLRREYRKGWTLT